MRLEDLRRALARWERTPYKHGWCAPGQGVDCWYFVGAIMDECCGVRRCPRHGLPENGARHSRRARARAVRRFLRAYHPIRRVPVTDRVPVTVLLDGGFHAMIVADDGRLWDAGPDGVRRGGREPEPGSVIVAAYRIEQADDWS